MILSAKVREKNNHQENLRFKSWCLIIEDCDAWKDSLQLVQYQIERALKCIWYKSIILIELSYASLIFHKLISNSSDLLSA